MEVDSTHAELGTMFHALRLCVLERGRLGKGKNGTATGFDVIGNLPSEGLLNTATASDLVHKVRRQIKGRGAGEPMTVSLLVLA